MVGANQITSKEALSRVSRSAPFVHYSGHALERMEERGVTERDVVSALKSANAATYQIEEESWKIEGGVDLDGEALVVVVAFEPNGDVVVTLF